MMPSFLPLATRAVMGPARASMVGLAGLLSFKSLPFGLRDLRQINTALVAAQLAP